MTLRDKIYQKLYKSSRLSDGVRCVNEDEWPIDQLLSLFKKEMEGVIGEDYLPESTAILPEGRTVNKYSFFINQVKAGQRKNLSLLTEEKEQDEA